MIETRAYPWKVGKNNRSGVTRLRSQSRSYQGWKSWTSDVTMVLSVFCRESFPSPVVIPVDLDVLFVLQKNHCPPDRTNLLKSFEDILQGIIYLNDRQVQGGDSRRVFIGDPIVGREGETWDGPERIHFRVTSLG